MAAKINEERSHTTILNLVLNSQEIQGELLERSVYVIY